MRLLTMPFLIFAGLILPQVAMAFNCSGITLPSSIVICSDADLQKLADERLAAFEEAKTRLTDEEIQHLREDQALWVNSYPISCGVRSGRTLPLPIPQGIIECFRRAGEARLAYLRTYGSAPHTQSHPSTTGLGQSDVPSPHFSRDDPAPAIISMEMSHGIYVIPVRINGELTLRFIVDSGASDVSIPADVALTLLRTGTIEENDFVGDQHYRLGGGSTIKGARLMLRKLQVGNEVVQNVKVSIGPVESVPLLGQSFLSKFGTWTLDNERHVLLLGPQRPATSNSTYASPELSRAQIADTRTQAAEKLPELTSSKRWLIVASRGDLNEAISVAQKYKPAFPETLVVKSENGQYGITIGRFDIVQNPSVLIEMIQAKRIPKDSYMSMGKRFISIVWQ